MKLTIALCIIALTATPTLATTWADHKPFCKFPSIFPVSRKPTDKFVDLRNEGRGKWYAIAYRDFKHRSSCTCMATTYGLEYSGEKIGTAYHCAAEEPYINVWLTPKNENQSDYSGWMRFSPTGKFWIPFSHWILDSDPAGQWHIVGEPCGEMVFIMSRTKSVSKELYGSLVQRIRDLGFGESMDDKWTLGCDQTE